MDLLFPLDDLCVLMLSLVWASFNGAAFPAAKTLWSVLGPIEDRSYYTTHILGTLKPIVDQDIFQNQCEEEKDSCNGHPQPVDLLALLVDFQHGRLQPLPQFSQSVPHLTSIAINHHCTDIASPS